MRVLLLNQTFYPDVVSTAHMPPDLAAGLADAGHEVTVIASRRAYDAPSRVFPARERWRNVRILPRCFDGARQGCTLETGDRLRVVSAGVHHSAGDAATIRCSGRHDEPAPDCVLAALFVRLKGGVLALDMDLNPDEAIAAGALRRESLMARGLSRLLRFSLAASSGVVVLDRFMRDRVIAKGVSPRRVAILPPWSHSSVVHYDERGRERFARRMDSPVSSW